MKHVIFLVIILVSMHTNTHAQTGRYGSNEGICLFDDHTFMLYGYATAVFGKYEVKGKVLHFHPDKPELFEIYATASKDLGDTTRTNFVGFDGNNTCYVRFNKDSLHRVFNKDANCFDPPFVYDLQQPLKDVMLVAPDEKTYYYQNGKGYNNFIIVYSQPKKEYMDFEATLDSGAIKTSNYGAYFLNKDDHEWQDILDIKKRYYLSKESMTTGIFVDKDYNIFFKDVSDRDLQKFMKLPEQRKENTKPLPKDLAAGSIFFTVCGEGSENSYHYKGKVKPDEPDDNQLIETVPAPIPQK